MKNVHFRLTYVAAKRLCLSSLLSRKWTSQSWRSPLPSPFKMANDKKRFFAAFVLFTEEVTEPQLPAPLPLQALFVNRLVFVAGEAEDGRVSPTLWYSTPPPDDIDPEVDLVRHRPPLATLKTRRKVGRLNVRNDFWDCYWGLGEISGQWLTDTCPVTIPEVRLRRLTRLTFFFFFFVSKVANRPWIEALSLRPETLLNIFSVSLILQTGIIKFLFQLKAEKNQNCYSITGKMRKNKTKQNKKQKNSATEVV